MNTQFIFHRFFFLIVCLLVGTMISGCEDSGTVGGALVDAVSSDGDHSASENLSGTWVGISGSSQCATTVTITDRNGALSGNLRWAWGGSRNLSGTRSGNSVSWVLACDEKDAWQLSLSSDRKTLRGNAKKNTGGGYQVSLQRQ